MYVKQLLCNINRLRSLAPWPRQRSLARSSAHRQPNRSAQLNPHLPALTSTLLVQEVEIEFAGIERVDASWVMPTYRRSTPPINSDKRKVGTPAQAQLALLLGVLLLAQRACAARLEPSGT